MAAVEIEEAFSKLVEEARWTACIAGLYDPETIPDNLRIAHNRNDETLMRITIDRRFKNDTERLDALFQFYTEMLGMETRKK